MFPDCLLPDSKVPGVERIGSKCWWDFEAACPRTKVIPSTFQNKTPTLSTTYSTFSFGIFSKFYAVARLFLVPFKHPKLCSGAWPEKNLKCLLNTWNKTRINDYAFTVSILSG